jgi:hypothetical protein
VAAVIAETDAVVIGVLPKRKSQPDGYQCLDIIGVSEYLQVWWHQYLALWGGVK